MDKKLAGLLGAAAALSAVNGAQAATPSAALEPAASYRDLLEPVPNALAMLRNEDSQTAGQSAHNGTQLAQLHHHHHHHHGWWRRYWHHHHHHHHHHRYYRYHHHY